MVPKVKRFREWLLEEMEKALTQLDGGWGYAETASADVQQLGVS